MTVVLSTGLKFQFASAEIFRAAAFGGLVMILVATGATALVAVLFNLISDIVGGVRATVIEEESVPATRE